MATQFRIQVDDLWLTFDGESDGVPCKIDIENRAALLRADIGNTVVGNNGKPLRELPQLSDDSPPGGGRPFAFVFKGSLPKAKYDALKVIMDAASADPDIEIPIVGNSTALGNFSATATVYDDPVYLNEGDFVEGSDSMIKGVRASFMTISVTTP